jgi:hypothetical protein
VHRERKRIKAINFVKEKKTEIFLYKTNKLYHLQMAASILTTEDFETFKIDLLQEIKKIVESQTSARPNKWLRSIEVRKLLNLSNGTLQNLRINGTLSYTKVGGIIYYSYTDIEKVLEVNKVQGLPNLFK